MTGSAPHGATWLLVGASGRVGRLLTAHWRRQPPPARLVCQFRQGRDGPDAVAWSPLDGPDQLVAWMRDHGPVTAMLIFAGATPGSSNLADNRRVAEACLTAASRLGIATCLAASSSAIYGSDDSAPFHETCRPHPTSAYGRAKLDMEQACMDWRSRGLAVSALRIGNVAGADALLGQVSAHQPRRPILLDRFADGGGPVRSYIDAATLAQVIETLVAHGPALPACLNVAAPAPVAMADLLDAAGLPWSYRPAPSGAAQNVTLDCTRLASWHRFDREASDPAAMVEAWRSLAGM